MTMKSMTGFGRAALEREGRVCTVEIRAVNHRYCDLSFRLPRTLQALEPAARRLLQQRFPRGSISVSVTLDGREDDPGTLVLNGQTARRYVELLRELQRTHALGGELDINTVAQFPDLLSYAPGDGNEAKLWPLLEAALGEAADRADSNRRAEGRHLETELRAGIERLTVLLREIEDRGPDRAREMKEKLRARLASLTADGGIDPGRLAQEIAVLADRIDYTEECVRLRAHAQQFVDTLAEADAAPQGRRLNFVIQEMGREANTIGSKANDPQVSPIVIELKEEIEKLREQVQNIE